MNENPPLQVFYHADRNASLKENQEILLNENGLSVFGSIYWPAFQKKSIEEMNHAEKHEFYLEEVRKEERYSLHPSRLQSIFAANSLTEAIVFASEIIPKPKSSVPIIEIYSNKFRSLDSNWMDFISELNFIEYYRNYWDGLISNHRPSVGLRRPPRIEVMIPLPARTGKIVHVVEPNK